MNMRCQDSHEKDNMKVEVNEYEVLDALAMLRTVVLNVVYVVHK